MSAQETARPTGVAIAVASETLEMHPQTLRKYERAGLLRPRRRQGGSRRYSPEDIERLELIKHLAEVRRINVAGMALALALRDDLLALVEEVEEFAAPNRRARLRERLEAMIRRFHE